MCGCLKKLKEHVTAKTGDPDIKGPFQQSFGVDMETGKMRTLDIVYLKGRTKKKDGSFTKTRKPFAVEITNCPFCGAKR
jgi:hypothetical protein